jgi:hypothetical protein
MTSEIKPIHKFNGGVGATLCNTCRKIIATGLTDDLYCDECDVNEPKHKYYLFRVDDGLKKRGDKIIWIEFGDDGLYESKYDEPAVGRNLVLDFCGITFKWMTTTIKEILEQREDYIKFVTKNSTYELFIYKD